MLWYLLVLKKYAVFSGRSSRKEFWYFSLISFLISIVLAVADVMAGTFDAETGFGLLLGIYTIAVLIPGIAVSVRRLHNTDRSGWLFLIGLIPLIGGIILIVFWAQDSQPGENQYGSNPKDAAV